VWHHSRAHRFFASAAWSADAVGLVVLRLVTGWLIPIGAPVVIAIDDTMFRRAGRKVHAAYWAYDGSAKVPSGSKKVSRGNTFVVAAVIVELPFVRRTVALPVAARLWRRRGPAKTALARELIELIAAAPAADCATRRPGPPSRPSPCLHGRLTIRPWAGPSATWARRSHPASSSTPGRWGSNSHRN